MPEVAVAGWDLGGAHLKLALAGPDGRLIQVRQIACPLWQGMAELERALDESREIAGPAERHAVTMTGELADLFSNRAEGVAKLIEAITRAFPEADVRVFAGRAGFLDPEAAAQRYVQVASANWLASAALAAARVGEGLFLDIGSTTTDIIPFARGEVLAEGLTDEARLISEELVYTGITRTPVMALAGRVPFAGERQSLMAELFATMADVYRLTGELPDGAELLPAADGGDKTPEASARRLARMLGRDAEVAEFAAWRRLADYLAERQRQVIHDACDRVLSRGLVGEAAPVVGAGIGRFLAARLAAAMGRPYRDFAELIEGEPEARELAARCAPAAAVALLALKTW